MRTVRTFVDFSRGAHGKSGGQSGKKKKKERKKKKSHATFRSSTNNDFRSWFPIRVRKFIDDVLFDWNFLWDGKRNHATMVTIFNGRFDDSIRFLTVDLFWRGGWWITRRKYWGRVNGRVNFAPIKWICWNLEKRKILKMRTNLFFPLLDDRNWFIPWKN